MAPAPDPTSGVCPGLEDEIARLHEHHAVELHRYALSIARNHQTACDAVQGAFLRYFIERRYGREIGEPRVWLYQAIRNELSEHTATRPAAPDAPAKTARQESADGSNSQAPAAKARSVGSQFGTAVGYPVYLDERCILS